ncbi:hypothetical protein CIHG_08301 [Coccidioides immitis H538.4]|uniref:Uncharacterized protein n=1 Tax=Coccidioides immitis H538.4 TaxID=396776 RepID=A0A0J8RZH2_COCIT|nr:hypothetical protein CIHG_08301 [Coccidioides immitis H538.4]
MPAQRYKARSLVARFCRLYSKEWVNFNPADDHHVLDALK